MKTLNRLFYSGAGLGLALSLTLVPALQCNNDNTTAQDGGSGNRDLSGGGGPHTDGSTGGGGGDGGGGGGGGDGGNGGGGDGGSGPGSTTLTAVSPSSGPTFSSTPITLTLTGTNFPSDAQVYIDGHQAVIQGAITPTSIMAILPTDLGKKGKVLVEIRRQSVGTVASNANLFSYYYGEPGFGNPQTFAVGTSPWALALGSLKTAGTLDAVVANYGSNNVTVLTGNNDGTFTLVKSFAADSKPVGVALADFDHDGMLDVASINLGAEDVNVLLNPMGNGMLGTAMKTALTAGSAPTGIVAGLLNNDVYPDVVTANSGTNNISYLTGAAGGNLSLYMSLSPDSAATPSPGSVALADMNGDGYPDIVVANDFSSTIGVLLSNKAGGFTLKGDYPTGVAGPRDIAIGDFNGDGKLDVAVTLDQILAPKISVLFGGGDGSLGAYAQYTAGQSNGDSPYGIASGDLNGDGLPDLVVALYGSKYVSVMLSQQGTFPTPLFFQVGNSPKGVALGDLDKDGRLDVVTVNYTDNQLASMLNKFQ